VLANEKGQSNGQDLQEVMVLNILVFFDVHRIYIIRCKQWHTVSRIMLPITDNRLDVLNKII
jgi:hypothetical protein